MDKYKFLWETLKDALPGAAATLDQTSASPEQVSGGRAAFKAVEVLMKAMENL